MKHIFIDLETTGTDPKEHEIWQLCGIIENSGLTEKTFEIRMKPEKEWNPEALEMSGLSAETLSHYKTQKNGYQEFLSILQHHVDQYNPADKFIMYGYNVGFDENFLREWFLRMGNKFFGSYFWWPSVCVAQIAIEHLQDNRAKLKNFKLQTICKYLILEIDPEMETGEVRWHDAMMDVAFTRRLYETIRRKIDEKGSGMEGTGQGS